MPFFSSSFSSSSSFVRNCLFILFPRLRDARLEQSTSPRRRGRKYPDPPRGKRKIRDGEGSEGEGEQRARKEQKEEE
jgi:hypothetical protein